MNSNPDKENKQNDVHQSEQQIYDQETLTKINKQVYIRADIIQSKKLFHNFCKIFIVLWIIVYLFKMLPQAYQVQVYEPTIYNTTQIFDIHHVNPFSRKIKVYLTAINQTQDIGNISRVQVFGLKDLNIQKQKVLDVQINSQNQQQVSLIKLSDLAVSMRQYKQKKQPNTQIQNTQIDISDNNQEQVIQKKEQDNQQMKQVIKYYLGDIHILEQSAYRLKLYRPPRVYKADQQNNRNLQQITDKIDQNYINISVSQQYIQQNNNTIIQEQQQRDNRTQMNNQTQSQQIRKQEQQIRKQQERKKIQEQQRIKQQERKRIYQQQRKQKQRRQKQQAIRKQQQDKFLLSKRMYQQHNNLKVQVYLMSKFSTTLQLIIRFISALILVYAAADNPQTPSAFWILPAITVNPLMFIQVSFPNNLSSIIDTLCVSAPLLYPALWLAYINMDKFFMFYKKKQLKKLKPIMINENQEDENKEIYTQTNIVFGFQLSLAILIYVFNVLRLLHVSSMLFWETCFIIALSFIFTIFLWRAYLNISQQQHRDIVSMLITGFFLFCWLVFRYMSRNQGWMGLVSYIVIQSYGIHMIYILGRPKYQFLKKQQNDNHQ